MTTVTIDDALATRLRLLGDKSDDLNALVADMLAEGLRLREQRAAGRAEMQAMLDGPRHTLAESHARMCLKHGFPDLSHLTRDELAEDAERIIAAMDPQVRSELEQEGLL